MLQLTKFLEEITDGFCILDMEWNFSYIYVQKNRILHKQFESLIGKCIWDEFPEMIYTKFYYKCCKAAKDSTSLAMEEFFASLNRWFEIRIYSLKNEWAFSFHDITDKKNSEKKLLEEYSHLSSIFNHAAIGIALVSLEGELIKANPALTHIWGRELDELLNMSFREFTYLEERFSLEKECIYSQIIETKRAIQDVEIELERPDQSKVILSVNGAPIYDMSGNVSQVILSFTDITRLKIVEKMQKEINQELERLSTIDFLTEINNRRAFDEFLEREWKRCVRYGLPLSLIMLDIDYFKKFNDIYGHRGGDHCLKEISDTLKKGLKRPSDFIARYGGEEFSIVLPETDEIGATVLAEALRKSIEDLKITHPGSNVSEYVTISLGIATACPNIFSEAYTLIEQADQALYEAKQGGRNKISKYPS